MDDYRNLTYKNVMGLQWAVEFCPQAQMLIKIDDDTAINLPGLLKLAPPMLNNGALIGRVINGGKPLRRRDTKWRVSRKEWPKRRYPRHILGYKLILNFSVLWLEKTQVLLKKPAGRLNAGFFSGFQAE
jgi:Galactosyltransferase